MFAKLALFTTVFMTVFVAASIENACNTGDIQCCNSLQNADSADMTGILSLIGVVAHDVVGQVGLNCSPVTLIGAAGNSCSAQPVCCDQNNYNGLVAVGCTPVNLNL